MGTVNFATKARLCLISGVSLLGLCTPGQALATEQSDTETQEIIVTAQKREQSVEDVPITISVVGEEFLRTAAVQRVSDVIPYVPALGGFTTGVATSVWSIRGLSSSTTDGGGEPSVGVYRDEAYAGYLEFAALPVYDVARIEVLKGPQGTLFGKNSSAGAISIYTNKPDTDETTGLLVASLGNFGQRRAEGHVNLPLSDRLAVRIAGQFNRMGDYQDNLVTGGTNGGFKAWGLRAGVLWQPTDNLELWAYYERYDAHSDQWATNTQAITGDRTRSNVYSVLEEGTDDLKVDSVHLELKWNVTDRFTLKAISGYSASEYAWEADAFATPVATTLAITQRTFGLPLSSVLAFQLAPAGQDLPNSRLYQQEIRGIWEGDNLFVTAGVNYSDYRTEFPYTGAQLGADLAGIRRVDTSGLVGPRTSLGLFLDGSWQVADSFTVTAGIRYSRDDRDWTSFATSDIYPIPAGVTVPPSFLNGTRDLNRLVGAGCPSNIVAPCIPAAGVDASAVDEGWTPRLAFNWEVSDSINVYGGYSRGFKAGGFNAATVAGQVIEYLPETVNAYELGFKGSSGQFRYGAAAFWSDFENLQLQTIVNALLRTSNAASARSRGIEAELNWRASGNFSIFTNFTYLDSEYTAGTISQGITVPARGLRLLRSPEFSLNIGGTASIGLGTLGRFELSPILHTESSTELSPINRADFKQPAFTTVNVRSRFVSANERWSLSLIGENLTNARLIRRVWDPLNLGASVNYNPDGAMVRAELEIQF